MQAGQAADGVPPRRFGRRRFLARAGSVAGGGAVAALLAACGASTDEPAATPEPPFRLSSTLPAPSTPVATPVPPRGRVESTLLRGTQWETPLVALNSGVAGPVMLVLGGVHGNEPGGWLAADEVAGWEPARGSLLVAPRANRLAIDALERTLPDLGDLNRLYPGDLHSEQPMERMAAAIVEVARRHGVGLLVDLHESWGFYAERTQNGTAFLGQTVTSGPGDGSRDGIASALIEMVNADMEVERDLLIARDYSARSAQRAEATGQWSPGRGGSSLSIGRYVRGLTPVLVEVGQEGQALDRRVELHRRVVRAALRLEGMLDA